MVQKPNNDSNDEMKQIILEEYKTVWECYRHTFTERKNIYEWYSKIIALPTAIIGILCSVNLSSQPDLKITVTTFLFSFLLLIFLTSICIFVPYTIQSANSISYLERVHKAHKFVIDNFGEKYKPLFGAEYINPNRFSLTLADLKAAPIAILDSGIFIFLINFYRPQFLWLSVLIFIVSLVFHIGLSWVVFRWIRKDWGKDF